MHDETDEALMGRFRRGEVHAFEVLLGRHRRAVYNFVLRFVRDPAQAEDLLQDTFLRVIKGAGAYEEQSKFTTWLYTIAHNRMIDHWRKRGLEAVSLDEDDAPEPSAPSSTQPERRAELNQSGGRLIAALAALPALQREAFLLHEESGLSVAEIAASTGCGPEAAKSRLRYAIAKLREALVDG